MHTTRAYPIDRGCQDCGNGPTKVIRFWSSFMPYRVCKVHAREYRWQTLRGIDPYGEPIRSKH
jgi:hypothetical protein